MTVSITTAHLGYMIDESLEFSIEIHDADEIIVTMKKTSTNEELSIVVEPEDIDQIIETGRRAKKILEGMS
jgi:hypothetical protein